MGSENKNTITRYPGNKKIPGVYQKIINEIPECSYFYELFAGIAVISNLICLHAPESTVIHVNDIDTAVTDKFNCNSRIKKTNFDFFEIIQSDLFAQARKDNFIFLDPPHLHQTRPVRKKQV